MRDSGPVGVRTRLQPGDLDAIVRLHGVLYALEYGFDHTFEGYVAGPLAEFAKAASPRERIWIAERYEPVGSRYETARDAPSELGGVHPLDVARGALSKVEGQGSLPSRIIGCIAIVAHSPHVAQLRWFLVDPAFRGAGLGRRLVHDAVEFCREAGYDSIILWTVSALTAAAHLYRSVGFEKVEEKPGRQWGVDVVEERYEMRLKW